MRCQSDCACTITCEELLHAFQTFAWQYRKSKTLRCTGSPRIFKNHFPYFFNTKFRKFHTITFFHFSNSLITKRNFPQCIKLHKSRSALPSVKFCSKTWDMLSIQNFHTFSILSNPRGNPGCITTGHRNITWDTDRHRSFRHTYLQIDRYCHWQYFRRKQGHRNPKRHRHNHHCHCQNHHCHHHRFLMIPLCLVLN